jgi:DNA-binding transcriptional LysR family regulator
MITVKHLQHLRAIIQHGTILSAAEALHLTHPALTRSLNNLESTLGIQLFDRSRSGMTPTAFCLQIAGRCEQMLLDMYDIQREAEIYRHIEGGELHIAVGRAIKDLIIRNTLPEFIAKYPKVAVTVSEDSPENLIYRTKQREVDLLLAGVGSYRGIEGISFQHLKDIPLSVIVGSSHPLCGSKQIQLEQLASYPLIAPTELNPTNPLYTAILNASDNGSQKPPISVLCSDYVTLKAILLKNHSWLLASETYFEEEIANGELCKLDINHPALKIELSVLELNGRSRSPAAQAFIDICQTYLDSLSI